MVDPYTVEEIQNTDDEDEDDPKFITIYIIIDIFFLTTLNQLNLYIFSAGRFITS